jgi:hypothetical protein
VLRDRAEIAGRLDLLRSADPGLTRFGSAEHRYLLNQLLAPSEVTVCEARYGLSLPEDYRSRDRPGRPRRGAQRVLQALASQAVPQGRAGDADRDRHQRAPRPGLQRPPAQPQAPPDLRQAMRTIDQHVASYITRARLGKAA